MALQYRDDLSACSCLLQYNMTNLARKPLKVLEQLQARSGAANCDLQGAAFNARGELLNYADSNDQASKVSLDIKTDIEK